MTRLETLIELRDKVKAGTARMPDATRCYGCKDGRIDKTWGWKDNNVMGAYNGSLDAAKALHEAVLPQMRVGPIQQFESGRRWYVRLYCPMGEDWPKWTLYPSVEAASDTLARAWLLAILEALIAQEPQP